MFLRIIFITLMLGYSLSECSAMSDLAKCDEMGSVEFRAGQETVLPVVHIHSYNTEGTSPITIAKKMKKKFEIFKTVFGEKSEASDFDVTVQSTYASEERLAVKPQYCFCSLASKEAVTTGALKGMRYNLESPAAVQYVLFRDDGLFMSSVAEPAIPVSIHNFISTDPTPALSGDVLHLRATNPDVGDFNSASFSEADAGHIYALVYNINFSDVTLYAGADADFQDHTTTIPLSQKNRSGVVFF